jgi:hypothetical protein
MESLCITYCMYSLHITPTKLTGIIYIHRLVFLNYVRLDATILQGAKQTIHIITGKLADYKE